MGTTELRTWNSIERVVRELRPALADAISCIVRSPNSTHADLRLLEWVLEPGECLVDHRKLKIGGLGNSGPGARNQDDQQLKFTITFPLAIVWKGCIEVSEEPVKRKQYPRPSYIARAGDLLGVFEVHDALHETTFELHACFRSPIVIPPIADKEILREWSSLLKKQVAHEKRRYSSLDLFPFVRAALMKQAVRQGHKSGATLLLFPQDFVRAALDASKCPNAEGWLTLSAVLWRDVAQSYRYTFLRSQIERSLRYSEAGEKRNLETKMHASFIKGDLAEEIVWTALSPRLPASCGLILEDFFGKSFAPHMQAVQSSKSAGPIILMPAHLHWPEVAWGVLWGQWPERTRIVAKNLSGDFRERLYIRSRDGTACTTYPGTEWRQAASLLEGLLNFSEPGITLTEHSRTWGDIGKTGTTKSRTIGYTNLVFFTKPDVLIDFIYSRLRDLCSTHSMSAEVDAVQHLIQCNVRLLAGLRQWIPAGYVRALGKAYSTSDASVRRLTAAGVTVQAGTEVVKWGQWESVFRKEAAALWQASNRKKRNAKRLRLIIDDGGFLHAAALSSNWNQGDLVAGVEQTTSGIASLRALRLTYPVVNVAQSWVKRRFESPLIAEAVASRCKELFAQLLGKRTYGSPLRVAIIGASGALGEALTEHYSNEERVIVHQYDQKDEIAKALNCDVLFGSTGEDILKIPEYRTILKSHATNEKPKVLISCSSGDIEFKSLLLEARAPEGEFSETKTWPAGEIVLRDSHIRVLRGGFPYNFDNSEMSVSLPRITLTTMLMAAGMFQAASLALNGARAGVYELSPDLQAQILGFWFDVVSRDDVLTRDPYSSTRKMTEANWIESAKDAVKGLLPLADCELADNMCRELATNIRVFRQHVTANNGAV